VRLPVPGAGELPHADEATGGLANRTLEPLACARLSAALSADADWFQRPFLAFNFATKFHNSKPQ
jgi:hypothetical protein